MRRQRLFEESFAREEEREHREKEKKERKKREEERARKEKEAREEERARKLVRARDAQRRTRHATRRENGPVLLSKQRENSLSSMMDFRVIRDSLCVMNYLCH